LNCNFVVKLNFRAWHVNAGLRLLTAAAGRGGDDFYRCCQGGTDRRGGYAEKTTASQSRTGQPVTFLICFPQ
jgi:hypothetical protein